MVTSSHRIFSGGLRPSGPPRKAPPTCSPDRLGPRFEICANNGAERTLDGHPKRKRTTQNAMMTDCIPKRQNANAKRKSTHERAERNTRLKRER
eukprot:4989542-Alexandrium_andersonii.AAC.1